MKRTIFIILLATLLTSDSATLIAAEDSLQPIVYYCPEKECKYSTRNYTHLKGHHVYHTKPQFSVPPYKTFTDLDLCKRILHRSNNPHNPRQQPATAPQSSGNHDNIPDPEKDDAKDSSDGINTQYKYKCPVTGCKKKFHTLRATNDHFSEHLD